MNDQTPTSTRSTQPAAPRRAANSPSTATSCLSAATSCLVQLSGFKFSPSAFSLLASALLILLAPSARAVISTNTNASLTWGTSAAGWNNVGSGNAWDSSNGATNIAFFATNTGTIAVSTVWVNGITWGTNGQNIASSLTLGTNVGVGTITLAGTTPTFTVNNTNTTQTLIINSVLAGTDGLIKTGVGVMRLMASNSYTGNTIVRQGFLNLGNTGALGGGGALVIGDDSATATTGVASVNIDFINGVVFTNAVTFVRNNAGQTQNKTLQSRVANATFSGPITITNNVNFSADTGATLTLSGVISGGTAANALTLNAGTGTVVLSNTNNNFVLNNSLFVNRGTLILAGSDLGGGATNGIIGSGSGALAIASSASNETTQLLVQGANTITRAVNFNLVAFTNTIQRIGGNTADSSLFSGAISLSSGANSANTTFQLTAASGGNVTFSGLISGTNANALTKVGAGTVTLSGSNNYTGGTAISAGTLQLANVNALAGGGTVTFTGGTLLYGSGITTDLSGRIRNSTGAIAVDSGANDITFASAINSSNTNGLTKTGTGTLTLTASNSYTGNSSVNAGRLTLGNTNALSGSTFAGGAGILSFGTLTGVNFGGLSGSTALVLTNDSGNAVALTVGGNNFTTTYSGNLSGEGGLTKTGTGALTLSGSNSYAGNTAINAGILSIATTNALPGWNTNRFSVASGATLAVYNAFTDAIVTNMVYGTTTENFAAGSAIGFDTTSGNRTLSLVLSNTAQGALGLTKSGAGTLTITNANSYTGVTTVTRSNSVLRITDGNALGSTAGGTVVDDRAELQITNNVTVAEAITIRGFGATRTTLGAINSLGGNNTLTGLITVDGATNSLNPGGESWINAAAGTLTLSGGVNRTAGNSFQLRGSGDIIVTNNAINLGTNTLIVWGQSATSLVRIGVSSNTAGEFRVYYTGRAQLTTNNAFSTNTALAFGSSDNSTGWLDLNGTIQSFGNLSSLGTGSQIITNTVPGASTMTLNQTNATTFGGQIGGAIALVKNGAGQLTLSGSNNYSGGTAINAGILSITTTNALPGWNTNRFSVASGATLAVYNAFTDAIVTNMVYGTTTTNFAAGSAIGFDTTSGDRTLTMALSNTAQGALGLAKVGGGSLFITNANTYTGGTLITGINDIELRASQALGLGSLTIGDVNTTGTLRLRLNGYNQTITGLSVGSGPNNVIENNTTNGGGTGTLTINLASGTNTSTTNFLFRNSATNGATNGNIALVKDGAGFLNFSTYSTMNYAGGLTVNAGGLGFTNTVSLGTGSVTLGGGTLRYMSSASVTITNTTTLSGSSTSTIDTTNGSVTYSGAIGGAGGLTKTGTGTLTLSASNSYTGNSSVNAGRLVLNSNALAGSPTITVANGGTLFLSAFSSINGKSLTLSGSGNNGNGALINNESVSTNNSANITLAGNATILQNAWATWTVLNPILESTPGSRLTLSGTSKSITNLASASSFSLSASNSFSGGLVIDGARVNANAAGWAGAGGGAAGVTVTNGGGIDVAFGNFINGSFTMNEGALFSSGGLSTLNNSGGMTISGTNNIMSNVSVAGMITNNGSLSVNSGTTSASTISGTISGSGSLTKVGTGTVILSGSNSYTGDVTVSQGTLQVSSIGNRGVSGGNLGAGTNINLGGAGTAFLIYNGSNATTDRQFNLSSPSGGVGASITFNSGGGGGTLTITSDLGITGSGAKPLTLFATGGVLEFAGRITNGAGVVSITKEGTNNAILSNTNNSFSGFVTVRGGNLFVSSIGMRGSNSAMGSGTAISIGAGASSQSLTYTGTGDTTDRTLIFDYRLGTTTINANGSGLLRFTGSITNGISGQGSKTLTLGGTNSGEWAGALTDPTPGTTASMSNFPIGATTLTLGSTVGLTIGSTLTNSAFAGGVATITNIVGNNVWINTGLTGALGSGINVTNGAIVNPMRVTKADAGTWTLSGSNSYTGGTAINAGILSIATTNALPGWNTNGGFSVASNATLAVYNAIDDAVVTSLVYGDATANFAAGSAIGFDTTSGDRTLSLTLSNTAQGALGLTKAGAGTLTLTNANAYTGTTTVSGGTLIFTDANALGASSGSLAVTGGTLDLSGYNITKGGLSGNAGGVITNASGSVTLTLVNNNASFGTYNGTIAGDTALLVTNTATSGTVSILTLGASNSYTGGTTIGNAQVVITNGAALGTGGVDVTQGGQTTAGYGGSLVLGGGGAFTVTNNITNASQGYGSYGGGLVNSSGSNTITGTVTLIDSGSARITAIGGTLNLSGGLVLNSGTYQNSLHHAGGNIFLNSEITGPGNLGVIGNNGTNALILGINNAWSDTMTLQMGVNNNSAARIDLNGTIQSVRNIAFGGGQTTNQVNNLITNSSTNLATLTVNNGGNVNASNTFGGNMALVKIGAGNLTLVSSNNYTGTTTVGAGQLTLSNSAALGSTNGGLSVTNGVLDLAGFGITKTSVTGASNGVITNSSGTLARLFINNTDNVTTESALRGNLGLSKLGAGTLTLTASNNYTNSTQIGDGQITLGNSRALGATNSALVVSNNGTLDLNGFSITKNSISGNASNTNGGVITNSSGQLAILTVATTNNENRLSPVLAGNLAVLKTGAGTLTFNGAGNGIANSYTGGTTISEGLVFAQENGSLGNGFLTMGDANSTRGAELRLIGATNTITGFSFGGNFTSLIQGGTSSNQVGASLLTIDLASGTNSTTTNVTIRDNGSGNSSLFSTATLALIKNGAGFLDFSTYAAMVYSGGLTVNAGGVGFTNSAALGAGTLTLGGGTIRYMANAGSVSVANTTVLSSNTSTIDTTNGAVNFTGAISGAGGLAKTGTGVLTLSGSNNYGGNTAVNAGILSVTTTNALPGWNTDGRYSVASNATLAVYNAITDDLVTNMVYGTANFAAGSAIGFDTASGNRTLSLVLSNTAQGALGLAKLGGGSLFITNANTYTGGTLITGANNVELGASQALGLGSLTLGDANTTNNTRLNLNGYNQTITGLSIGGGATPIVIQNENTTGGGVGTLTIDLASGTNSSTANFFFRNGTAGTLALVKNGEGFLNFSTYSTMNYSGGLTVNGGGFGFTNAASLGFGGITLGGGTLRYMSNGGSVTIANTTTLTGSTNSTIDTIGSVTYSGAIGGAGGLTKTGTGTLTLSGSNSYSGVTAINEGMLTITATNALPGWNTNGAFSVASNATLAVYNAVTDDMVTNMVYGTTNFAGGSDIGFDTTSGSRTLAMAVSDTAQGALGLTKAGANSLTLTNANSYTGETVVSQGTLIISNNLALGSAIGSTTVTSGAELSLIGGITVTGETLNLASGGISSAGGLRSRSGNNTWTGDINIGLHQSRIASDAGLLTLSGDINNGVNNQLLFQGNGNITVSGIISGGGSVATSSSSGSSSVLTLSGLNTFTGQFQINRGIVSANTIRNFGQDSSLGRGTSGITIIIGQTVNSGTLLYTGTGDTTDRNIRIGTTSATGSATIQNEGTGALVFTNANFNVAENMTAAASTTNNNRTLTLSGSNTNDNLITGVIRDNNISGAVATNSLIGLIKSGSGRWILSGNNTFTGGTTINAGILTITATNALPGWNSNGSYIVANGGTLAVGNSISEDNVTNMVYGTTNFASNSAIGFDTMGGNRTLSLVLSNPAASRAIGLTKAGAGTLTLTNANTYTGTTTVSGGTLMFTDANALGTSSGSLAVTGGILDLSGFSITKAGLSGNAGGVITNASGSVTLTLVNSNASFGTYNGTIAGATALLVTNNSSTNAASSILTLGASNSYSGGTTIGNASVLITNGAAFGSGAVTVTKGGLSDTNYGGQVRFQGDITVTNAFNISGYGFAGTTDGVFRNMSGSNRLTGLITTGDSTARINVTGGTLVLGDVDLTATAQNQIFMVNGGDMRLTGLITGSATSFNFIGNNNGTRTNTIFLDRANMWSNTMNVGLGNGSNVNYINLDLNGNNQTVGSITAQATNSTALTNHVVTNSSLATATFTVNNASGTTASNTFAGNLAIVKTNNGTFTLGASNSYTGGTLINQGNIGINNSAAFGTGTVTIAANSSLVAGTSLTVANAYVISNAATATFDTGTNAWTGSGEISGAGSLTKIGTGTLTLSASNSYTGVTTISAGTLNASNANALGAASGAITAAGGTLNLGGNGFDRTGMITFSGGTVTNGTLINNTATNFLATAGGTVSASLAGSAGLTKTNSSTFTLTGSNSYTGVTTIAGGAITISNNNALGATNGGTVVTTNGNLSLSGNINVAGEALTLNANGFSGTLNNGSGNNTWGGAITLLGSGFMTQSAGTLTLTGGITAPSPVTLQFNGNSGGGGVNVSNNAIQLGTGTLIAYAQQSAGGGQNRVRIGVAGNTASLLTVYYQGNMVFDAADAFNSNTVLRLANTDALAGSTSRIDINGNNQIFGGFFSDSGFGTNRMGSMGILTNSASGAATLTMNQTANATVAVVMGGNLAFVKNGGGTITWGSTNNWLGNTYTGGTILNAGGLTLATNEVFSGNMTVNGGTFNLGTFSDTLDTVTLGNGTISGTGTLTGTGFSATNSTAASISASLAGSGGLTKTGNGTLTLSGSNSYSGGTAVDGGTLALSGGDNRLSTDGSVSVSGGATFNLGGNSQTLAGLNGAGSVTNFATLTLNNAAGNNDFSGSIRGTGSIVKNGGGTLTLSGSNSYSGGTTLNEGVLAIGNNDALGAGTLTVASSAIISATQNVSLTNNINITTNATAIFNSINILTNSGGISGSGSLTQSGGGTLVLTGNTLYTGTTTIAAGSTLQIGNGGSTGSIGSTASITNSGTLIFNRSGNNNLTKVINGNGNVQINTGTARLSGNNAVFNGTGSLTLASSAELNLGDYDETVSTFAMSEGSSIGYIYEDTAPTLTADAYNLDGGTVNAKLGVGTITVGGNVALNATAGANRVNLNNGTLTTGAADLLNSAAEVIVSGSAALSLNGSQTLASLTGSGNVTNNSGTLTLNIDGDNTFDGSISGDGSLAKGGNGTLTLMGSNEYSGGSSLNSGTVAVGRSNALGSGLVTMADATLLSYIGSGAATINNDITVGSGTATIANQTNSLLTLGGTLTKDGSTLTLAGGTGGINVTGNITGSSANSDLVIGSGTVTLSGSNSYNGPTFVNNGATLNANSALPTDNGASDLILDSTGSGGSTVNLGVNQTIASLSGATNSTVNLNTSTLTITNSGTGTITYAGSISASAGNLLKSGAFTQMLTGTSAYTGTTTVNGGALSLGTTGSLTGTTNVTVNSGSTLLLGSSVANSINTNAALNLNGGSLSMGAAGTGESRASSQTFASLTLTGNSSIDFSSLSGVSSLYFTTISGLSTYTLSIFNYNGETTGTGPDYTKLYAATTGSFSASLGNILFYSGSDATSTFLGSGSFGGPDGGFTQIVPVPEPSVVIAALMLLAWLLYTNRAAMRRLIGC